MVDSIFKKNLKQTEKIHFWGNIPDMVGSRKYPRCNEFRPIGYV